MTDDPRRYVVDAIAYADRIAEAPHLVSHHARSAAARFLRDLDAARRHKLPWVFDENLAQRAMLFASMIPRFWKAVSAR